MAAAALAAFAAFRAGSPDGERKQPDPRKSTAVEPQYLLPGFVDERVAKVPAPTSLAFPGDGRMLVTSQKGRLVSVEGGFQSTLLDLTRSTCSKMEQGLLGMTLDPAFAQNHHVYLFRTARLGKTCMNRVSRFTLGERSTDSGSEKVLIDNIPSKRGNHNGGDVRFGPDGYLYVSVGDGGCHYALSHCHGKNDASRERNVLLGKVLRISALGAIPADNPYAGAEGAPCALAGRTEPGKICAETFLWGLRNPFRIAFDPDNDGRFFINDPGQDRWEEINEAMAGADYGWNLREGRCENRTGGRCRRPDAGLTDPIFTYSHSGKRNCGAVTGGAFVPGGIWPAPLAGSYLFADFVCGEIFRLESKPSGGYRSRRFAGGFGPASLVHMEFGPNESGTALYLTSFAGGGEVRRLTYDPEQSTRLASVSLDAVTQ